VDQDIGLIKQGKLEAYALTLIPEVVEAVQRSAKELTRTWLKKHRGAIKKLSEARSDAYNEVHGLAADPEWSQPAVNDADWDQMNLPGYWADETSIGDENGAVWFRKEVTVPKSMTAQPAKLWLGRIVDQDSVFVNGKLAGTTGYQYPPRRYIVDSTLLKEGKNEIAVRVINNSGKGGFIPDKPYYLAAGGDTVDLKGPWKYRRGTTMQPLESQTFIRWKPGGLYNRMIAPLFNYGITGAIWYQGESNADTHEEASKYQEQFTAMINNWRQEWNQGDFPFLFVQLANFMETNDEPTESAWAELRQAQLNTLSLPNTGMAVTIDIGEWNDIHPLNKKDVGIRLALQAKKIAYGEEDIVASGPVPSGADFKQDHVLIKFDHVGDGLTAKNGDPEHFAISGDGEHFVWANAEIMGNSVRVWSEQVSNPTVVRYAWADNPESANLYNKYGLPASPFQISKK
jgi:sialate O-acetylesterase